MVTTEVFFYRVNAAALPALRRWGERLMGPLRDEAIDTLYEENCVCESLYLLGAGDLELGCFIGIFDGPKKPPNMNRAINQEHFRHFDAALQRMTGPLPAFDRLECVYHLDRSPPPARAAKS